MDIAKNFAKATVDGGYEDSATSIDVLAGEGDRFAVAPFNVVWWNATDFPDPADDPTREIVRVTSLTDDTLTITRAQEGTAASDHNLPGKTYKLIAGITARTVNEEIVGDVFGSGPAVLVDTNEFTPEIRLRIDSTAFIALGDVNCELQHTEHIDIGDVEGEVTGAHIVMDGENGRFIINNAALCTTQSESATGPVGTVVGKLAIHDAGGTLIGYLPVYGSIT